MSEKYLALAALSVWAACAQAAPENGLGVYFGVIHSSNASVYGTGNGASVGADAQFAVNDNWSLNPYLEVSYETTSTPGVKIINGTAGLSARRWFGEWFLGGALLFHDELQKSNGTTYASTYGTGIGVSFGWEGKGHWTFMGEVNALERQNAAFSTADTRSDVRLLVGYRWY